MIRAYPWQRLPRLSRSQLSHAGRLRALLGRASAERFSSWAADCLGVGTAGVRLVSGSPLDEAHLAPATVQVELVGPGGGRAALFIDSALAAAIISGLLGGSAAPAHGAPPSAGERGVLAYGVGWLIGQQLFPLFPRRVLLTGDDLLGLGGIVLVISVLASLLGIWKAMNVAPNEAIG